jgi:serine/threonine protein kinase
VRPDQLRRFEDEARAAAALNHPNILSVLDIGTHLGSPYVVFELLEGETISDRLARGPLPPRKVIDYAVQVCDGLAAAHAKGIVHRDLKPSNLFLSRDGHAKILDFGLAKLAEGPVRTRPLQMEQHAPGPARLLLGTLAYMSRAGSGQPADARSDVFSLGRRSTRCSRAPAFQRATAAETLAVIRHHDPKALGSLPSGPLPPTLEPIVRRCLEKEPDERFQSARDLGFALKSVLVATPAEGTAVKLRNPRATWRWLASATGLAIVSAVGLWAYFHADRPPGPVTTLSAVPFTTFPGSEDAPTFSPDGSQIAFAWWPEGAQGSDLYVKVIGSETPLRLTTHPASLLTPAWSPDGRQIAFARLAPDGSGIFLVPALGGPERKVAKRSTASSSSPAQLVAGREDLATATGAPSSCDVGTLDDVADSPLDRGCWPPAFSQRKSPLSPAR